MLTQLAIFPLRNIENVLIYSTIFISYRLFLPILQSTYVFSTQNILSTHTKTWLFSLPQPDPLNDFYFLL